MAIIESDLEHRYSGGTGNIDPDISIGGAMSTVTGGIIISDTDNNDMDNITSTEAEESITIYRGYYFKNNVQSANLTWVDPTFWISSQTDSGDTNVEIGIADEAKNLAIQLLANEKTAPDFVTFNTPSDRAGGEIIGSLNQGDRRGHWVRYIVTQGASAVVDSYTIKAEGDTDP